MANKTKQIEEAQIELRAAICRLSIADLWELCTELHIKLIEKDTGHLTLIQTVTKYLDAEELDIKKLKGLRGVVEQKGAKGLATKVKSEPDDKRAAMMQKSDAGASVSVLEKFLPWQHLERSSKISGHIRDSRQKDQLSFTTLAHQINAGLNHGYKEEEVIEAVIRALNPGMRLRSYLECKLDLTFANLCKILRSHYQEKEATPGLLGLPSWPWTENTFCFKGGRFWFEVWAQTCSMPVLTLIADGSSKWQY